MKELSLNILDIVQNSIYASATRIDITVLENTLKDSFKIIIKDNGSGLSPELLNAVEDPFTTTRTTRRVGLGIPLFKLAAEQTGGDFEIFSKCGTGTELVANFVLSSIDKMPLGNIAQTITQLVMAKPELDFYYTHSKNEQSFSFSTPQVRKIMQEIALNELPVLEFINQYISENEQELTREE